MVLKVIFNITKLHSRVCFVTIMFSFLQNYARKFLEVFGSRINNQNVICYNKIKMKI